MTEPTIFQHCVDAVEALAEVTTSETIGNPEAIARAVIQTILDLTPSPRTVDELTYILSEAPEA